MSRSLLTLTSHSDASKSLALDAGQAVVAISEIRLRKGGDSRQLYVGHVITLAESIAILGLLEPIVVDTKAHLLAGGHRLAALHLLAIADPAERRAAFLARIPGQDPKALPKPTVGALLNRLVAIDTTDFNARYPKGVVPVQVADVSGRGSADLTLAIEAAENTTRRQYTRDEVIALAERFKAAGYTAKPGKPAAGEKPVMTALEAALGLSRRQIQRIINGEATLEPAKGSEWLKAIAALRRVAQRVVVAGKGQRSEAAMAVATAAEQTLKTLEGLK